MRIYTLYRKQFLPVKLDKAWDFFSSPHNLEIITPAKLNFKIKSELKKEPVEEGMRIEYRVTPFLNIPLTWLTEITNVKAPLSFTDKQIKGPYSFWEHTHSFKEMNDGVVMIDELKYALPLGILGRLAHTFFVERQLNEIFDYRREVLDKLFKK